MKNIFLSKRSVPGMRMKRGIPVFSVEGPISHATVEKVRRGLQRDRIQRNLGNLGSARVRTDKTDK